MANSIVFQSSADQLKSAVYGYDGTNYQPLKVDNNGSLDVTVATINNVINIGTLDTVNNIGTLNTVNTIGTLSAVVNLGTLDTVVNLGTLNTVTNLGTLNTVNSIGTLNSIVGTVKVNLADRTFLSTTYTVTASANTTTYTDLLDISKYQDTSWYLRNLTSTNNRAQVSLRLAVTPSSNLNIYPRVLISQTATLDANPKVITNDYYMKYITTQVVNATNTTQTVVIIFNGRY